MANLARPIAEAKLQLNIGDWWNNSKVYGEISRWVSVTITETETRAGGPMGITSYTLNIDGAAVVIKLNNGELIILTPFHHKRFIADLESRGIIRLAPEDSIRSIPRPNLSAAPEKAAAEETLAEYDIIS